MPDQAEKLHEAMIDPDGAGHKLTCPACGSSVLIHDENGAKACSNAQCEFAHGFTSEQVILYNEAAAHIREEVQAEEIGGIARDEDEATLLRYLRSRQRTAMELEHIKEQTKSLIQSLERRLEWLDQLYTPICADIVRRKLTGKSRSIKTPFGTAGFRTVPPALVITDEAKLRATIATQGLAALLRHKEPEIAKNELNDRFKSTGELLPGTDLSTGHEKFYAK